MRPQTRHSNILTRRPARKRQQGCSSPQRWASSGPERRLPKRSSRKPRPPHRLWRNSFNSSNANMPQREEVLFRIDQALKKRGLPGMPTDALREVAKWVEHPEAQQQLASGEMTPDKIAEEVSQALTG